MDSNDPKYRIAALLAKLQAGIITPGENDRLEDWAESSPENRDLYNLWVRGEGLQEDYLKYSGYDTFSACRAMEARIRASKRLRRRRRLLIAGGAAAAVLAAVILRPERESVPEITLISGHEPTLYVEDRAIGLDSATIRMDEAGLTVRMADGREQVVSAQAAEPVYGTVVVPKGRIFEMELADGTQVTLNADSRLRYPVAFGPGSREVELSGEAFFEVTPDQSRPFRVATDRQRIEVVGTEFNVEAYPGGQHAATTVLSGIVRVSHGGEQVTLEPGMQALSASGAMEVRKVKTAAVAGWRDGMFTLEGKPLERVMDELARWYDFQVVYDEEAAREIMFRGSVPHYGEFARILELMERTDEVRFEVKENKVHVRTAKTAKR